MEKKYIIVELNPKNWVDKWIMKFRYYCNVPSNVILGEDAERFFKEIENPKKVKLEIPELDIDFNDKDMYE